MAGQRATAPDGDAGLWPEEDAPTRSSRRARRSPNDAGTGGRRAAREAERYGNEPRRGPMHPAVPALGLPLFGAAVGQMMGSYIVLALCSLVGAVLAVSWSSRPGWWWAITSAPLVIMVESFGVAYLMDSAKFKGAGIATEGLQVIGNAFPAMALAVAAGLVVVLVRRQQSGRGRRG